MSKYLQRNDYELRAQDSEFSIKRTSKSISRGMSTSLLRSRLLPLGASCFGESPGWLASTLLRGRLAGDFLSRRDVEDATPGGAPSKVGSSTYVTAGFACKRDDRRTGVLESADMAVVRRICRREEGVVGGERAEDAEGYIAGGDWARVTLLPGTPASRRPASPRCARSFGRRVLTMATM